MGGRLLGVALGLAQGATLVVPAVIETYPTPRSLTLMGGDFDAAGVLHLSVPFNLSAGAGRFAFDPDTGVFTPVGDHVSPLMPDGDWAIDLSGAVVNYSMAYTGWADYCPDAGHHRDKPWNDAQHARL